MDMNGQRDDFIDALTYQVKEEVINNYLRERLILEEEIKEYRELIDSYHQLESEVRNKRDELACLLVNPRNFGRFFDLLGFSRPPLSRVGHGPGINNAPTCPLELSPKGLTKRSQYIRLTIQTYGLFHEKAALARSTAQKLIDLAKEINQDIGKFHRNFDLMAIIHFLKRLDMVQAAKKKFLGDNFSPSEMDSLEQKMRIKTLNSDLDGIRVWPELPSPEEAGKATAEFLRKIFRRDRESILPALV